MSLLVRVSVPAGRDLVGIWQYTRDHWTVDQANAYVDQIRSAANKIAEDPRLTRPADDIRPGLRRFNVGSHVLFVRITSTSVRIVRILHGSMDAGRHL